MSSSSTSQDDLIQPAPSSPSSLSSSKSSEQLPNVAEDVETISNALRLLEELEVADELEAEYDEDYEEEIKDAIDEILLRAELEEELREKRERGRMLANLLLRHTLPAKRQHNDRAEAEELIELLLERSLTNPEEDKQNVNPTTPSTSVSAKTSSISVDEEDKARLLSQLLRTKSMDQETDVVDNEDQADYIDIILQSMDKNDPFILHKDKLLELLNRNNNNNNNNILENTNEKRTRVFAALETEPKVGAMTQEEGGKGTSDSEKSMLVGVLVVSLLALVISIGVALAIVTIFYNRRSAKHTPLLSPSPRLPLFSPKDGFSTIYKNRAFNIPQKSKREAEENRQQMELEEQRREREQLSPVIDEAHYGTHEFLNASLSSI